MLHIRNAKMEDLPGLVRVENLCFPKEEAATRAAFKQRIQLIPDSFLIAEVDGAIAGLVNGPVIETAFITDDLFCNIQANPLSGGHQSILGLAVDPQFQKQGIASALLGHLETEAKAKGRETITLTCKKNLIRFYENHGYFNRGISDSVHAGVTWYNMIKRLQ